MEAVIFIGIQATGKSTFYKEKFFNTHIRINLDMLKTRRREKILIDTCLESKQKFVIDNTNPNKLDRKKYFDKVTEFKFKTIGYYFKSSINESILRNNNRKGTEHIPIPGIKSTHSKLELPSFDEGFDELYYVEIIDENFIIREWNNEI